MYYAPGVTEIVKGKWFSPPRQSQSLGPEVTQSCPSIIVGTSLARFLICSATSKLKTAMSVKSFFYHFTRHWQKKLICQYSVNNTFVLVIMENRCKLCLLLSVTPFYFNCVILAGDRSNRCLYISMLEDGINTRMSSPSSVSFEMYLFTSWCDSWCHNTSSGQKL